MDFLKKVLKISAVVILVVVFIYMLVWFFFLNDSKSSGNYGNFGKMVAGGGKASTVSTDKTEVNLDKVLINMRSGKYQYMKADMTFNMANEDQKEQLIANMPRIRDTILRYAASQDSDKLATPQGKDEFKANLKEVIEDTYGYSIDAIYFRNFVLAQ